MNKFKDKFLPELLGGIWLTCIFLTSFGLMVFLIKWVLRLLEVI